MKREVKRGSVAGLIIGLSLLGAAVSPVRAAQPKAEFSDLVHDADVVFVGRVEAQHSHLNVPGNAIVTDVTFSVGDVIHEGEHSIGIGESIVLSYFGGSIEGLSMRVSDAPSFVAGEEYLLFAFNDGQGYINPLIGGPQGQFKLMRDAETGAAYPVAPGGRAIEAAGAGAMRLTPKVLSIRSGRALLDPAVVSREGAAQAADPRDGAAAARATMEPAVLSLEDFKAAIRAETTRERGTRWPFRRGVDVAPQMHELPGLTPNQEAPAADRAAPTVPQAVKASRPDLEELRELRVATMDPDGLHNYSESGEGIESIAPDSSRAALCYCGFFDLNLVMQEVPTSWDSWQHNENSMWLFNQFMDIYRTTPSDGGFGDNSENEFCGWVTGATMMSIYGGSGWGTSLAVTATFSSCNCCEIVQADVMFNPAYSWVYSFDAAFNSSPINYQPVVIHELGHTWGLQRGTCNEDYSYSQPSVMHAYYSGVVEDGWGLHGWDAFAIREIYDAQIGVPTFTDVGVESYIASGSLVNAVTNAAVYRPGDPISIFNITTENMSNTTQTDVRLRFYLSTNRTISTGDHQIGGYWFYNSIGPGGFGETNVISAVPNVPPGTYYVGVIVSRGGDSYLSDDFPSNNSTWLPNTVQVLPPLPGNDESENAYQVGLGNHSFDTTGATTDGYAHLSCNTQNNTAFKDVWYRYTPLCSGTLTASTCNNANFDTVVAIYWYLGADPPLVGSVLACSDDEPGCGTTSVASAYLTEGYNYLIRVGGWSSSSIGTGTLNLSFDPNLVHDDCVDSIVALEGTRSFNTLCATTDGLAHNSCQFNGQTYNDIWFHYTATCDGDLTVSTCGQADYDTDVVVYSTRGFCPPGDAQLMGCNDDTSGCAGFTSEVTVPVVNGSTYLIRIGGYNAGDAGHGSMTISLACAPPTCLGDANRDGVVTFADITSVLTNWLATYPESGLGDANFDGVVDFADITTVLQNWGNICPP